MFVWTVLYCISSCHYNYRSTPYHIVSYIVWYCVILHCVMISAYPIVVYISSDLLWGRLEPLYYFEFHISNFETPRCLYTRDNRSFFWTRAQTLLSAVFNFPYRNKMICFVVFLDHFQFIHWQQRKSHVSDNVFGHFPLWLTQNHLKKTQTHFMQICLLFATSCTVQTQ